VDKGDGKQFALLTTATCVFALLAALPPSASCSSPRPPCADGIGRVWMRMRVRVQSMWMQVRLRLRLQVQVRERVRVREWVLMEVLVPMGVVDAAKPAANHKAVLDPCCC
jgi:hypothetical protein